MLQLPEHSIEFSQLHHVLGQIRGQSREAVLEAAAVLAEAEKITSANLGGH